MQKTVNILNKRAKFDFEILDRYTAGIVLTGTEIKSIRLGKASIAESFCEFHDGELFVINSHIEEYLYGTHYNHKAKSERKLLLNKRELKKLNKDSDNKYLFYMKKFKSKKIDAKTKCISLLIVVVPFLILIASIFCIS